MVVVLGQMSERRDKRKQKKKTKMNLFIRLRKRATFASMTGKADRALIFRLHPAMPAWYVSHHTV
jgi:hypothetical protein